MHRCMAYLLIGLSLLFGFGSLIVFVVLLFFGLQQFIDLKLSHSEVLIFDAALCLLFFIQHSVMSRKFFQQRLSNFIHEDYVGALFSIVSGIVLFIMIVFWQVSSNTIAEAKGVFGLFFRVLFIVFFAGATWAGRLVGFFDPFGIRKIIAHLRDRKVRQPPFVIKGPYLWVRHPIYFCNLVMIWSFPILTADRLLFNILWSSWICIGTVLEERNLFSDLGNPYREYQRKVPMLFPYRIPKSNDSCHK